MKRRSFMGLLGAVGITGPKGVAKAVVPVTPEVLGLAGIAGLNNGEASQPMDGLYANEEWGKKSLVKFLGLTDAQEKQALKNFYMQGLDPDTHALRSVSLGTKMTMSRRRQYAQWKHNRKPYLEGVITGLWD